MKKLTKIQVLGMIVFGAGILFNGATLADSIISEYPDINFYSESLMSGCDQTDDDTAALPHKDPVNGLNIFKLGEIEANEKLTVNLGDVSRSLDSVWITDAFINGSDHSVELGLPSLSDADNKFYECMFERDEPALVDDEIYVSFALPSGFKVMKTTFMLTDEKDITVAAFDESPEPVTMLFLGFGLVGITSFRKKFMKKKQYPYI